MLDKTATDLIPSSKSPPLLFWTECRRLRRKVKRRRRRVGWSEGGGLGESIECWCWYDGDWGVDVNVVEDDWLKRSKNVLFRFDGVRLGNCVGLFDVADGVGRVILGNSAETDIDLLVAGTSREACGVDGEGMIVLELALLFGVDDELGDDDDDEAK